MKALFFATIVCVVVTVSVAYGILWPPDAEFPTITETTLEAQHIIVGEVIHVSFLIDGSHSLATVRVDWDILEKIKRAEDKEASKESNGPPKTVTFIQMGGPTSDGGEVEIVGWPMLHVGDRVFLRLIPSKKPAWVNGIKYDLAFNPFGGGGAPIFDNPKAPDDPIVKFGWGGMHMTVSQLARITRATLKRPKQMQSLERRIGSLKGTHGMRLGKLVMPPDPRMNIAFDEIKAIETELKLPPLPNPKKGGQK